MAPGLPSTIALFQWPAPALEAGARRRGGAGRERGRGRLGARAVCWPVVAATGGEARGLTSTGRRKARLRIAADTVTTGCHSHRNAAPPATAESTPAASLCRKVGSLQAHKSVLRGWAFHSVLDRCAIHTGVESRGTSPFAGEPGGILPNCRTRPKLFAISLAHDCEPT